MGQVFDAATVLILAQQGRYEVAAILADHDYLKELIVPLAK